jgi:hypothetical protein
VNILEALNDEHLFAPHFTGEMAWTAARKRRGGSAILSKPSAMTLAVPITFQKAKSSLSAVLPRSR